MLKLGEKNITKLYYGDRAIKKAYLGDKLVYKKDGGRFVESILFDGASYIDTGIKYQNCTIECDIKFEETGTRQLMGFTTNGGHFWGKGANSVIIENLSGTNVLDRTLVTLECDADNKTLTINADGQSRTSSASSAPTYTYTIGAVGFSTKSYFMTGEIWRQKTIVGGELIQDLRPYVDENNVACFKDVITGELFYNQGTGTLGYTESINYKPIDIDYTRIRAYISVANAWASASDSYSILIPIEVGKRYRLEWETTTSDVGTIFRYGQTDIPKAEGQVLKNVLRTSPQTAPIVDITAVNNYLVVQIASSTADVIANNKYLKAYEIL